MKKSQALDRVLQRLTLFRLFLPLVAVSIVAISAMGYLSKQTLEKQQKQRARSMARIVDFYLDQAGRTIDAVAGVAESAEPERLSYMFRIWKAYRYFDTLYYLNSNGKIRLLVPPDPQYQGFDMSNLPDLKQAGEKKDFTISRPFISLHTSNPTVYLIKHLDQAGHVVGELNLGSLQDEITHKRAAPDQGMVFILDEHGMLLAHPVFALVQQQTNKGNLEIFRHGRNRDITRIYSDNGTMVLGSTARVEQTGWVVVDQVLLTAAFAPYIWALGLTLMASLGIWLVLTWNLRRQLHRQVVIPLVQLNQGVNALSNGDFYRSKTLISIPTAFAELTTLARNFQNMSSAIETRQAAVQASEERYRTLFEQVPVALYRTTPSGKFLDVNKANIHMLGYPDRETLLKANVADLYPDLEDRSQWPVISEHNGDVRDFVMKLQKYDGRVIWVRNTSRAVRDDTGRVLCHEGSLEDITTRRQAEESIRKLSQAIEQSPVSIVITDIEGKIEFVNTKFTQITGYSFTEALGRNPRILKSGETSSGEYKQLWDTIASGRVWQGKLHNRKKSGDLFWEHVTIAPVRNNDNVITHYVAVKEDITEQKKLEEQFRQTQKMEAVGQLAGGVAHDFNNMLSVISGHAELALAKTADNESLHQNIKAIMTAAHRSIEITRQLLAFARKQTIMPKILDLNQTIGGMLKLLQRLIGEDIDLVWLPGADLWPVKMDPSQIDQILANLCVNARDAIPGVGSITIETQKTSLDQTYCSKHEGFLPGEYVMLTVSDTGCGMDKQTIDKIFEPFFTTKGVGKGTGLGLATVYGIVKQNNGFINVYSEPGQGTAFKIYLSRHAVKVDPMLEKKPKMPLQCGDETILLVEDDSEVLDMVTLMLEDLGYTVLASSVPEEAIRIATDSIGDISLLVTDLVMPGMNGRKLAEHLTALNPELKYLFMSGYTGNTVDRQGVISEDVNFIQKPFSKHELADKVSKVLDRQGSDARR